ncbi:MAG: hypothetical protein WCR20_10365, partial [Verrucomicrobiota bacterium]
MKKYTAHTIAVVIPKVSQSIFLNSGGACVVSVASTTGFGAGLFPDSAAMFFVIKVRFISRYDTH